MRKVLAMHFKQVCRVSIKLVCITLVLSACGGGSSKNDSQYLSHSVSSIHSSKVLSSESSFAGSSSVGSSTPSVSSADTILLSGTISYDFIPHNANSVGLNYLAIEQRPVRGVIVELIDNLGQIKAATTTANDGSYSLTAQKNQLVKVRVKAQLVKTSSPSWDFKVTDNTSNNALYVLDGELVLANTQSEKRDLHADSGWDGIAYSPTRAAAPFAILDSIYIGLERIISAGNKQNLAPLELRWSTKNSVADGDITRGEIGTSFYDGSAIYILGDANNDTDEYDPHVLLHEWGHYLEDELFRSDSIGGDHADGQLLDLRVAMSEGFANAFSGMMLENPNYSDSSGIAQSSGFYFSIGKKNRVNKGYFSEGSVGSILYNYYTADFDKVPNDFSPIFNVLHNKNYSSSDAFTSIFLFQAHLRSQLPEHAELFSTLMQEQNISGTDEYASDELNNGGLSISLPVYKTLVANGAPVNVCSAAEYGKHNKLGNSQFLKFNIIQSGSYNIRAQKSGGENIQSKPEFILYQKGRGITYIKNTLNDDATGNLTMLPGNYVLEVYDLNNRDNKNTNDDMTCFNVRVSAN